MADGGWITPELAAAVKASQKAFPGLTPNQAAWAYLGRQVPRGQAAWLTPEQQHTALAGRTIALARKYPGLLQREGYSEGVDPRSLTAEDASRIVAAVERERLPGQYPAAQQEWMEQYNVPLSERAGWSEYPVSFSGLPPDKLGGYSREQQRISLSSLRPGVIGHEMAHANFYENMPGMMRLAYPFVNRIAQWLDPSYRATIGQYPEGRGRRGAESYATAYSYGPPGQAGPEVPRYMEPFYGNLMYPVSGPQEKSSLGWLSSWLGLEAPKTPEAPKTGESWQQWMKDYYKIR